MSALAAFKVAGAVASWGAFARSGDSTREADVGYMFMAMVDFAPVGEFMGITGFNRQVNFEEYAEGGRTYGPRYLFKGGGAGSITLKWGLLDRSFMWDWIESVQVGWQFRRELTVLQFTRNHVPFRQFHFHNAFPVRVKAGDMSHDNTSAAFEEVEIKYDKLVPSIIPMSGEAALANLGSGLASAAGGPGAKAAMSKLF
jgi:phage tail-like protein